jgi:hypothetical protein
MATTIKLKNSVTTTNAPSSLVQGEVAINVTDKKVWVGNAATTPVQLLGTGADGSLSTLTVGAGTVSAPAITTTGDTNTGIFFPAADTIAFSEGGVEAARFDSSGNLGIGTSSPSAFGKLGVVSAAGQNAAGFTDNTNYTFEIKSGGVGVAYMGGASGSALALASNGSERMRIDSSGNVGIGTSSPQAKLHVSGTTTRPIIQATNTAGNADIKYQSTNRTYVVGVNTGGAAGEFAFYDDTAGAERMRIDSSGALLVGTTTTTNTDGVTIQRGGAVNGGIVQILKTGSGLTNGLLNYYGATYVGGINFDNTSTSFPTSSDIRLKKNIVDAPSAISKVQNIRIVSHGWKNDDAVVEFGVIAQELAPIAPSAVMQGDDGEEVITTWSVDYSKLVPLLTKSIQEQQAIITDLKARIETLENK